MRKLTQAEFLERARATHADKYDYSQAVYTSGNVRVLIVCPAHGGFWQMPTDHFRGGNGCPKCGDKRGGRYPAVNTSTFIKNAQAKHGNKYCYDNLTYLNAKTKVEIVCPKHGIFFQKPSGHLRGEGCRKCAFDAKGQWAKSYFSKWDTTSARAYLEKKHPHLDFSQFEYSGGKVKSLVVCPLHGQLLLTPNQIFHRGACRACWREKRAPLPWVEQATGRTASLYFLKVFDEIEQFYKIGITVQQVHQRYHNRREMPYQYEVLALYQSTNTKAVFEWEQSIIDSFKYLAYRPKRKMDGSSECFVEAESILAAMPVGTKFY